MNNFSKTLVTAGVLGAFGVSAAQADYTVLEDPAFPSVLFFEIEGPAPAESVESYGTPEVISAPSAMSAPIDPGMAAPDEGAPMMDQAADQSGGSDVNQMVEQRIESYDSNPRQIEIDNQVDAIVLEDTELR